MWCSESPSNRTEASYSFQICIPHWRYFESGFFEEATVTVGRDGEACIVVDDRGDIHPKFLKIFTKQKGGGAGGKDAEEWALEKTIQLSAAMLGVPRLDCSYIFCLGLLLFCLGPECGCRHGANPGARSSGG